MPGKRCPLCDKPQNMIAVHRTVEDCKEESRRFVRANTPGLGQRKDVPKK
jgi:hypothetical protein